MPDDWRLISRMLIGWDIGVAVYLALSIWTAISTDTKHIRLRCVLFDEGRVAIPSGPVTRIARPENDVDLRRPSAVTLRSAP